MIKQVIYARAVGELVTTRLEGCHELTYHSLFDKSFNLAIDGQLIHIGYVAEQLSPFSIQLRELDFKLAKLAFNQGKITYNQGKLILDSVTIDVTYAKTKQTSLKQLINQSLSQHEISPVFHSFLEGTGIDFSSIIQKQLPDTEFIHYLIGRGTGLTPSGDDFIIGLLAVDTIETYLLQDSHVVLKKMLVDKQTTDISLAYLEAATQGYFTSTICQVLCHLSDKERLTYYLNELSELGHTSGRDTIAGIFYGLCQLKQFKEAIYGEESRTSTRR
ncbi:hypothetical protein CBF34_06315 [Vagococcus penaei]|uniref:Uncharacterized protein n=1 Tax=Vagococcus penaei TaxID=633807 RepID=A0A1Q2D727_9ENTE|nr:DUF2877 domain-containing protein [Vagococcus penaei]AQP54147.1 hypothetical protein BW732_07895 [Vagococcus penaei]RSU02146.1 hypothetical protein CBF34_06315 [Vagococcus penaei]